MSEENCTEYVSSRVTPDTKEKLDTYAKFKGWKRSQLIRQILEEYTNGAKR